MPFALSTKSFALYDKIAGCTVPIHLRPRRQQRQDHRRGVTYAKILNFLSLTIPLRLHFASVARGAQGYFSFELMSGGILVRGLNSPSAAIFPTFFQHVSPFRGKPWSADWA